MGIFEQFPYANFHELNADWLMKELLKLKTTVEEFVSINALKYADPIQWSIVRQYEKNTIVIDPLTGTAYISVQPVPSGVALTRTEYWTVVFDLGSFVVRAAKNFTDKFEEDTTLTATFPSAVNDWLIWGDTLYRVISNIVAGDQYVVGSNIQHFTIESIIGHLEDLTTSDKSNIVAAINEVVNIIGSLTDLTTVDKSNIVAAIDELVSNISDIQALIGDEVLATQAQTLTGAINEVFGITGNGEINELYQDLTDGINKLSNYVTPEMFGAVGDGIHDDAQAFNDAINSGFPIFVPHGTYLIGESLVFPDTKFITIIGEDKANTILRFEGAAGEYLFNIAGQLADIYRKYGRIENMQLVGNGTNNGIKLEYNSDKLSLKNLYIHNFVYGIKEVNGWSHSYYDIVITHCQYGYHGSGVINAIVFNNILCNLCDTNFYLHGGRNILIDGGDFGDATDYNMDVYGIAGLCINAPYIESIGTHGITFTSCYNMTINGFEISAFKEGDTIFNFISTSGTINGLTIDGQGWDGTTIIPNTVGINIEDCNRGISFNGVFLRNLAKGIFIKNTRGEIKYPRFEYVTTPIEFYNHEYIYMDFVMLFSDFVNCVFNASAVNTKAIFTDWKPYYNTGGGAELPKPSNGVVIPYNCMIMVNNGSDFKPVFRKYNSWVYADGTLAQSDT